MKDTIAVKLPLIALAALLAVGIVSPRADAEPQAHPGGSSAPMLGRGHDGADGGIRHGPRVIWTYPGYPTDSPNYAWWCGNPAGWYPSVGQCFQDWQAVQPY
jgi:hypothetical protein